MTAPTQTAPWRVTFRSGATLDLEARDRTHALSVAAELVPADRPVMATRQGEW
jgi:hypothetical protein